MKLENSKNGLSFISDEGKESQIKFPKYDGTICTIWNESLGMEHCAHPNIDKTGSVKGMKSRGFWREEDKIYSKGGYHFNMSKVTFSDDLDRLCLTVEKNPKILDTFYSSVSNGKSVEFQFEQNGGIIIMDNSQEEKIFETCTDQEHNPTVPNL